MSTLNKMEAAADEALAKVAAQFDALPEAERRIRLMKFNSFSQELVALEKSVSTAEAADVEFAVCEWLAKGDFDVRNAILLGQAASEYGSNEALAKRMGGLSKVAQVAQTHTWKAHSTSSHASGVGASYPQETEKRTRKAKGAAKKLASRLSITKG